MLWCYIVLVHLDVEFASQILLQAGFDILNSYYCTDTCKKVSVESPVKLIIITKVLYSYIIIATLLISIALATTTVTKRNYVK